MSEVNDTSGGGADDQKAVEELIGFLEPATRLDIRRTALQYVIALSAALDGSAARLFMANDFAMGKAVCKLCESTLSDRSHTLSALTNFSSASAEVASFILTHSKCTQLAYDSAKTEQMLANVSARLLTNLSRHFPDRVHQLLGEHDSHVLDVLLEMFLTKLDDSTPSLIGYTLVNLSTLSTVRHRLVESKLYQKICPLTTVEDKKEMAVDILRNLAFEDALHPLLLDDSDVYLVALLAPLADSADELSDDEIQKLPLRLQYYEGTRDSSVEVRQKSVEALYQLCATRHAREHLRRRGVYALLRELDRASDEGDEDKKKPQSGWIGGVKLLAAQQEHTLHALIGILIRLEDEMEVDPTIASLRTLE